MSGQLARLAEFQRPPVRLTVDGQAIDAMAGDTVLTALLTAGRRLRDNEFEGRPRAGFCLMGACQDCWVLMAGGERIRACTTFVAEGMAVTTGAKL